MVGTRSNFRLVIEIIAGCALLGFIGAMMLIAAFAVGWPMALGISIVFILEFIKRVKS